jgi:hypothetical protein
MSGVGLPPAENMEFKCATACVGGLFRTILRSSYRDCLEVGPAASSATARPQCYVVGILHRSGGSIFLVAILYPVLRKNLSLGARHL